MVSARSNNLSLINMQLSPKRMQHLEVTAYFLFYIHGLNILPYTFTFYEKTEFEKYHFEKQKQAYL